MAKRNAIGRDFYSLMFDNAPPADNNAASSAATTLRISEIEPRSDQPRKTFEHEPLEHLADSIAQFGVIQPIVVRANKNALPLETTAVPAMPSTTSMPETTSPNAA